jgi:hypothetical protein
MDQKYRNVKKKELSRNIRILLLKSNTRKILSHSSGLTGDHLLSVFRNYRPAIL